MRTCFVFVAFACITATNVFCQVPSDVDSINRIVSKVDSLYLSRSLSQSKDSVFHKQNGTFTEYYTETGGRFKIVIKGVKYNDSTFIAENFYYFNGMPIYATRFFLYDQSPECKFYFIGDRLMELLGNELIDSDDPIGKSAVGLSNKVGLIK